MEIILPKRTDGAPSEVLNGKRQITVVGANGAGKTRFVNKMMQNAGENVFHISALDALFVNKNPSQYNSISTIFGTVSQSAQFVKPLAETEFEMLLYLLLTDEMKDLFAYKFERVEGEQSEMPQTKIDTVIKLWKEVFPKNDVLRGSGKIRFRNDSGDDTFKPLLLSHGEKAVFFYIGASLYAPSGSLVFVDSPTMFLHRSITQSLWTAIEDLRPDCTFVYQTHDLEFPTSRADNITIWVRSCDIAAETWDYEIVHPHETLSEQLILSIIGSRKSVLFVEGDDTHSIDYKLYSLIFPEYTVKPMGSCNKVIETVRSFNDIQSFHHLDSYGIVDRDRRNDQEVKYLRNKKILVPNVAEIENILMLEGVIRAVARRRGKNDIQVFQKVRANVVRMFKYDLRQQALLHTRHFVKRRIEMVVDRRFKNIGEMETHILDLLDEIKPRAVYEQHCRDFNDYVHGSSYNDILRVYNQKAMLIDSEIAPLCGFTKKEDYIKAVLSILRTNKKEAAEIRKTIKHCFGLTK